jgi:hypothetical protein
MPGKRVRLRACVELDRTIAALRKTDLDAARALARLLFEQTTCRVVAASKTELTLRVRGGKYPFVVPGEAVRRAKQ